MDFGAAHSLGVLQVSAADVLELLTQRWAICRPANCMF
jgi:hypothetical protein